jgi:hypothetical protein
MVMVKTRVEHHPVGLLVIVTLSILIPACRSAGQPPYPWLDRPAADASVVRRPAYDLPPERTFYLSGYAGTSFAPMDRVRSSWTESAGSTMTCPPAVSVEQGAWITK